MTIYRSHLYLPIVDAQGNLIPDVAVRFYEPTTTEDITETLFTGPTGNGEYSSPVVFSSGIVDCYLALPKRVRLGVTPPGQSEFFLEDKDFVPAADNYLISEAGLALRGVPQPGYVVTVSTDGTKLQFAPPGVNSTNGTITELILQSPDETFYEVGVDDDGHLITTSIAEGPAASNVILEAPLGGRWLIEVDDGGHLITTEQA